MTEWKRQRLERAAAVLDSGASAGKADHEPDIQTLQAKIGAIGAGERFFKRRAHQGGMLSAKKSSSAPTRCQ